VDAKYDAPASGWARLGGIPQNLMAQAVNHDGLWATPARDHPPEPAAGQENRGVGEPAALDELQEIPQEAGINRNSRP